MGLKFPRMESIVAAINFNQVGVMAYWNAEIETFRAPRSGLRFIILQTELCCALPATRNL